MIKLKKFKRNSLFISIVCAIVLLLSLSFIRNFDNSSVVEQDFERLLTVQQPIEPLEGEMNEQIIVVDIKGAVNRPGVYELEQGQRIIDAVEKATGFHKEANKNLINLAALLEDEMVIFVPFISDEEENEIHPFNTLFTNKDDGKINVNRATVDELQQIPGIGPAKAKAIVLNREENGHFLQIDDIVRVPGIGQKSLENMKEFIKVK